MNSVKAAEQIEKETREKYSGSVYDPESICNAPPAEDAESYSLKMLRLKLDMINALPGDVIADVCCASGAHLSDTGRHRQQVIGIDFSIPFLKHAREHIKLASSIDLSFICCNAKQIPLADASVDVVYSLCSLYHIPNVHQVIAEMARILKPGGHCVMDMGTQASLNTIVGKAYPELAQPCHVSLSEMKQMCRDNQLEIQVIRSFQILPMWGDRPKWMRPLQHKKVTEFMAQMWSGKMIDERISSLPILRQFAFRQLFQCRKSI